MYISVRTPLTSCRPCTTVIHYISELESVKMIFFSQSSIHYSLLVSQPHSNFRMCCITRIYTRNPQVLKREIEGILNSYTVDHLYFVWIQCIYSRVITFVTHYLLLFKSSICKNSFARTEFCVNDVLTNKMWFTVINW